MGDQEEQTVGQSYAGYILQKWLEIIDLSERFRSDMMHNDALKKTGQETDYDTELGREYISKLTRLWLELSPKVEGNTIFKTPWREDSERNKEGNERKYSNLQSDFLKFRPYAANPSMFIFGEKENDASFNEEELFLLEEIERKVIEKLGITQFFIPSNGV